jgi:hypothetical protein
MLGDYRDAITADLVPAMGQVETMRAAFQEYGFNARYPHAGGMVEDPVGQMGKRVRSGPCQGGARGPGELRQPDRAGGRCRRCRDDGLRRAGGVNDRRLDDMSYG